MQIKDNAAWEEFQKVNTDDPLYNVIRIDKDVVEKLDSYGEDFDFSLILEKSVRDIMGACDSMSFNFSYGFVVGVIGKHHTLGSDLEKFQGVSRVFQRNIRIISELVNV